jgi:hypothetical protein
MYTQEEISGHLQTAITNRIKCKQYAPELQMDYRFRLAKAKEAEDNIPAAVHIINLTNQERTRSLFRRLKYLEKKMSNLTTSRITITTKRGLQKDVIHKLDIEKRIIMTNEKKFHQTEGHGQLQSGRLLHDLGVLGTGPKAQAVLNGTYTPPPGTSATTKAFLQALKAVEPQASLHPITFQEFKDGWIKVKE